MKILTNYIKILLNNKYLINLIKICKIIIEIIVTLNNNNNKRIKIKINNE